MSPRLNRTLLMAAIVLMAVSQPVPSEQKYDVSGNDSFSIGSTMPTTSIAYAGTQRLKIDDTGSARRFTAEATYSRKGEGSQATSHARFVQELSTTGDFADRSDDDPDFLTILNQPLAVQLDATTMNELRSMHGPVPFSAESPFGGATLHGLLKPQRAGRIGGHDVVGVRFEALGPMRGAMPQHPDASIDGTISMNGSAYYATQGALLLGLDATIAITGNLTGHGDEVPVRIVYRRSIRANDAAASWSEALHRAH